ncbi:MAG TPA: hypothetical protein PLU50_12560, partial [Pseudobdellovibrionaceae bacterium]|nr:hypothetical protein [Pseudobdellovibrionaceae bacterium]
LTFSALCATIVFGVLSHSFSTAPWKNIFTVIILSLIGQGPVIVIQLINEESRETFPFWLAGSVLALSVFGAGLKFRRPSLPQ